MSGYPSQGRFAGCLNTIFEAPDAPDGPAAFELLAVRPGPATPGNEQFALLFRAAGAAPGAQGVYRLRHPALGDLDVFLVPVGREGERTLYEAVFNLLR